ncbi:MAG: S9 family peptidase, partial [Candidatus Eisenbacteria bacterium]
MLRRSILLPLAGIVLAARAAAAPALPDTPKHPVVDVYHGQSVEDDYRWLENSADSTVRRWSDAQNAVARGFLDTIPERADILRRVEELARSRTPRYSGLVVRGGTTFAVKDQPPLQQPLIVVLGSVDDTTSERVVVDPNRIDPSGETTIDFYTPSLDGAKVAVSLSKGGTEDGTVHVFDVATGARLPDELPHVNGGTAGGAVAWNADGSGFWRTRYPGAGERPDADRDFYQQVYFHRLGDPASADRYVLGKEFPRIAEIALETSDDGRFVVCDVSNGDGGEHAFWLSESAGAFRELTRFADRCVKAEFGDGALYLLSRAGAPNGKLLRLALPGGALANARVVVPAGRNAIEGFLPAGNRLYVEDMVGGPSAIRLFSALGRPAGAVPLPRISSVGGMVRAGGDRALIRTESYTSP